MLHISKKVHLAIIPSSFICSHSDLLLARPVIREPDRLQLLQPGQQQLPAGRAHSGHHQLLHQVPSEHRARHPLEFNQHRDLNWMDSNLDCTLLLYCFSVFAAIIIFGIMGFKAHTTYDACLVEQASNSSLECDLQQELEKSARYSHTVKLVILRTVLAVERASPSSCLRTRSTSSRCPTSGPSFSSVWLVEHF